VEDLYSTDLESPRLAQNKCRPIMSIELQVDPEKLVSKVHPNKLAFVSKKADFNIEAVEGGTADEVRWGWRSVSKWVGSSDFINVDTNEPFWPWPSQTAKKCT
jgi:hypothetical protein